MMDIEAQTIERARAGDVSAFEDIYKAFFSFVTNVAYRVVGNTEDAQEVAQETFIRVYNNLKSFRFESSLKTWVYRITANTAINFAKKNAKHNKSMEFIESVSGSIAPDAYQKMEQEESKDKIQQFLNSLTPDHRSVIVLRSIKELSYQEIADTLDIPVNTVRTRLKRAREALLSLKNEVIQDEV